MKDLNGHTVFDISFSYFFFSVKDFDTIMRESFYIKYDSLNFTLGI